MAYVINGGFSSKDKDALKKIEDAMGKSFLTNYEDKK